MSAIFCCVLQVFLVIAILMGEGLYMVIKVLYSSKFSPAVKLCLPA